jgi:hypothetical protein
MITTKLPHIKKEDTIVLYGFQICIENDTQEIEDVIELEEIIAGATDEIIDNFESLSNEQKTVTILRINTLLETYNNGHNVQIKIDKIREEIKA